MDAIQGTYPFETFDFKGFMQEKRFVLVDVKANYEYDEQKGGYDKDKFKGLKLEIEIAQDLMDYQLYKETKKGVNEKARFQLIVDDASVEIEDYLDMIGDTFNPKEVFITEVDSARLRTVSQGKRKLKQLIVIGDISDDSSQSILTDSQSAVDY